MKAIRVSKKEFFDTIGDLRYQNQDIAEAIDFGYKSVQDAYRDAEIPWARFYVVKHRTKVLSTIMEQRDGVILVYTTVDLPGSNIRRYVKVVKKLLEDTVSCKDVVYTLHARFHTDGLKLLKLLGFYEWKVYNYNSVWVKEHGK